MFRTEYHLIHGEHGKQTDGNGDHRMYLDSNTNLCGSDVSKMNLQYRWYRVRDGQRKTKKLYSYLRQNSTASSKGVLIAVSDRLNECYMTRISFQTM